MCVLRSNTQYVYVKHARVLAGDVHQCVQVL